MTKALPSLGQYLEASAVLISEGVGTSLEDKGLPLQHVVLPRYDLHESLAAAEVQEGTPMSKDDPSLLVSAVERVQTVPADIV